MKNHVQVFFISLQIVFGGSESAIIYQCAKHKNATAKISTFKCKCAKHSFREVNLSPGLQRGCFYMHSDYPQTPVDVSK